MDGLQLGQRALVTLVDEVGDAVTHSGHAEDATQSGEDLKRIRQKCGSELAQAKGGSWVVPSHLMPLCVGGKEFLAVG